MTNYTEEDFAVAKFAEHPDGLRAMRSSMKLTPWIIDVPDVWSWSSDENMAEKGWVPVPSKPTVTRSQFFSEVDGHSGRYKAGYQKGFLAAGGVIIPDPEPTNAEKLADALDSIDHLHGSDLIDIDLIAELLDKAGVKAPGGES